jgi:dTDP-D-glucose 4,6-dehydratase
MRFLIAGGSGFIGSNLVRHLLAQGHQVCNIDALTYAGNRSSLADLEANPACAFHNLAIALGDGKIMKSSQSPNLTQCCIWPPKATSIVRLMARGNSSKRTLLAPFIFSRGSLAITSRWLSDNPRTFV